MDLGEGERLVAFPSRGIAHEQIIERTGPGKRGDFGAFQGDLGSGDFGAEGVDAFGDDGTEKKRGDECTDQQQRERNAEDEEEFFHFG